MLSKYPSFCSKAVNQLIIWIQFYNINYPCRLGFIPVFVLNKVNHLQQRWGKNRIAAIILFNNFWNWMIQLFAQPNFKKQVIDWASIGEFQLFIIVVKNMGKRKNTFSSPTRNSLLKTIENCWSLTPCAVRRFERNKFWFNWLRKNFFRLIDIFILWKKWKLPLQWKLNRLSNWTSVLDWSP